MNSDEMMSDPPIGNTTLPESTHSLIDAAQTQNQSQAAQAQALAQLKANTWNTNKFRDEYDAAKSRLTDQKFNVVDYPDPLMPRAGVPQPYPPGFTAEKERALKELIAKLKQTA